LSDNTSHSQGEEVQPTLEEAEDRRLMGVMICDGKRNYESALEHYVLASRAMATTGHILKNRICKP